LTVPQFSGLILHFYVDGAQNWERCRKTFEVIESLKEKYGIVSVCLDPTDDYAYWKAVQAVWGSDDIVIIEQDIVFKEKHLLELLKCKHKDCAFAFVLYPATTQLAAPYWNLAENYLPDRIRLYSLEEKPKFCQLAWGFVKLSKETQSRIDLTSSDLVHWKFLDIGTIGRLRDLKIHVHYDPEVEHAHRE